MSFAMDLARKRYPAGCARVYVLNYSWTYAGIWQVVKRMLPESALQRVVFCAGNELLDHIDRDSLLTDFGGNCKYTYNYENDFALNQHDEEIREALSMYPPSRSPRSPASMVSLTSGDEDFYSLPGTPRNESSPVVVRSFASLRDESIAQYLNMKLEPIHAKGDDDTIRVPAASSFLEDSVPKPRLPRSPSDTSNWSSDSFMSADSDNTDESWSILSPGGLVLATYRLYKETKKFIRSKLRVLANFEDEIWDPVKVLFKWSLLIATYGLIFWVVTRRYSPFPKIWRIFQQSLTVSALRQNDF